MKRPICTLLTTVCLTGFLSFAAYCSEPQWIVVTPPAFREPLTPLIEHRRAEGLRVVVVDSSAVLSPDQIRCGDGGPLKTRLSELCLQPKDPNYILLVGATSAPDPASAQKTVIPPLKGVTGRMKGEPSDNGYGCLAGKELMPEAAVGRFPARNAEDVRAMVQKTLRLEKDLLPGAWRNRLAVLVGNPHVGDELTERAFLAGVQERFSRFNPAWIVRTVVESIYSPFCLPSKSGKEMAIACLAEGEVFSIYLGHSQASGFFIKHDDWSKLKIPRGAGVFFTCGCYACRADEAGAESYGMAAMRNPDGPAAVMGAYGESYSAMGTLAFDGLVGRLSEPPSPVRAGDYWLAVKSGLATGPMDPMTFFVCDQADGSKGTVPLDVQRLEHLEMWTLLGDPALRLPIQPLELRLQAEGPVQPGKGVSVKGVLPDRLAGATVRVTLERTVASAPTGLMPLPRQPGEEMDRAITDNHQRANSFVLATGEVIASGTGFECVVQPPGNLAWPEVVLRACAEKAGDSAAGILKLSVKDDQKP